MADDAPPQNLTIVGNPLGDQDVILFESAIVDRYGAMSLKVSRRRYEKPIPTEFDWMDINNAPQIKKNLPCVGVERMYENGRAKYIYTYEGLAVELADTPNITFEFDGTMTQEPIQTHPDFESLKLKYGWNDYLHTFLENLPQNSTATPLSTAPNGVKKSPMFGVEYYLSPGGTLRKTYISDKIPTGIYDDIGLPASASTLTLKGTQFELPQFEENSKRTWLKLTPRIRRRGGVVEITEEYLLSSIRGWSTEIYSKTSMNDKVDAENLIYRPTQGSANDITV